MGACAMVRKGRGARSSRTGRGGGGVGIAEGSATGGYFPAVGATPAATVSCTSPPQLHSIYKTTPTLTVVDSSIAAATAYPPFNPTTPTIPKQPREEQKLNMSATTLVEGPTAHPGARMGAIKPTKNSVQVGGGGVGIAGGSATGGYFPVVGVAAATPAATVSYTSPPQLCSIYKPTPTLTAEDSFIAAATASLPFNPTTPTTPKQPRGEQQLNMSLVEVPTAHPCASMGAVKPTKNSVQVGGGGGGSATGGYFPVVCAAAANLAATVSYTSPPQPCSICMTTPTLTAVDSHIAVATASPQFNPTTPTTPKQPRGEQQLNMSLVEVPTAHPCASMGAVKPTKNSVQVGGGGGGSATGGYFPVVCAAAANLAATVSYTSPPQPCSICMTTPTLTAVDSHIAVATASPQFNPTTPTTPKWPREEQLSAAALVEVPTAHPGASMGVVKPTKNSVQVGLV